MNSRFTGSISIRKFIAIILDFDGVIVDSEKAQLEAWRWALKANGCLVDEVKLRNTVGWKDEEIIKVLVGNSSANLQSNVLDAKKAKTHEMYESGKIGLVNGAIDFIKRKSETHRIAIASNSSYDRVITFCNSYNLTHYFAAIITGERRFRPKPNPDIYNETVRVLGIEPARCVVIEDSIVGLQAAYAAGINRIGITTLFDYYELLPYSDWVISSFDEIK